MTSSEFIKAVLEARLKFVGLDIKLNDQSIFLIHSLSNGNPGYSLAILGSVLYHTSRCKFDEANYIIPKGYVIDAEDVLNVYPSSDYVNDSKLEEMWNGQKMSDGSNRVDTKQYWLHCAGYV